MVRGELVAAGRGADTLNHYRRSCGARSGRTRSRRRSPGSGRAPKPESEGQLRFYTPASSSSSSTRVFPARRRDLHARRGGGTEVERDPRAQGPKRRLRRRRRPLRGRLHDPWRTRRQQGPACPLGADERQRARGARPYCKDRAADALVFEHEAKPGEPICGSSLYRRFRNAATRAGLPVLRFHDMRHSFGTQAIRAFNIYEVQRMMGHRHITTTERYLHYAPNPEAAAKLSGLWSDDERPTMATELRNLAWAFGEPLGSRPLLGPPQAGRHLRKPVDLQRLQSEATTGIEPV